jgi:hypothetical protein
MDRATCSHEIVLVGTVDQTKPIIESLYTAYTCLKNVSGFEASIFENCAICYIDVTIGENVLSFLLPNTSIDFYDKYGFDDEPEYTVVRFYTNGMLYYFSWSHLFGDWDKMTKDEVSIMNLLSDNLFGDTIKQLKQLCSCPLYTIELENE